MTVQNKKYLTYPRTKKKKNQANLQMAFCIKNKILYH